MPRPFPIAMVLDAVDCVIREFDALPRNSMGKVQKTKLRQLG